MEQFISFVRKNKFMLVTSLLIFIVLLAIGIPTLARFKNRNTINNTEAWDGTIAKSYSSGNGTADNPYIISNGSELAYFSQELVNENYENISFSLSNDIVINDGFFNYGDDGITYTVNNNTYYVDINTNKYYSTNQKIGETIGTLKTFNSLNNFKGNFEGNSFTVSGLYMNDLSKENLALFTNLNGNVSNLYVDNSLIYGGLTTGGIVSNANDSTLKNVLFNGFVIGNKSLTDITKTIQISDITYNLQNSTVVNKLSFDNSIPLNSEIISSSLTGEYVINGELGDNYLQINNIPIENKFTIDLGTNYHDEVSVSLSGNLEKEIEANFFNVSYNVVYKYGIAGGLIAKGKNNTIINCVNKGFVYGYSLSGGLIGLATNTNFTNSYNAGLVNSNLVSGGLIGIIEKSQNNMNILNCYNNNFINAPVSGGLIGKTLNNTGNISINNTLNTSDNDYVINTIEDSNVKVTNSYYTFGNNKNSGTLTGSFSLKEKNDLYDKDYLNSTLNFLQFVNYNDLNNHESNVWLFEDNNLPILYFDDINNPVVNIHAGINSWNNYSTELSIINFNNSITISIDNADNTFPYKKASYYINYSDNPLSLADMEKINSWKDYNGIFQINGEGKYVVYFQIIDYNGKKSYLNTDIMVLDLTNPGGTINMGLNSWDSFSTSLNYTYISNSENVTITSNDSLSGIKKVEYYISNDVLSRDNLDSLDNSLWLKYNENISIAEKGNYIIYAKLTDKSNNISYINTNFIIYDGYNMNSLSLGKNNSYDINTNYITGKSSITLDYSLHKVQALNNDYSHNLVTNVLLPENTKILLFDKYTNKVYKYAVKSNNTNYFFPFTSFEEIGRVDTKYFDETVYKNSIINEQFIIIVDFYDCNIEANINDIYFYLSIQDDSDNEIITTLNKSIKKINVSINNSDSQINVSTDYDNEPIVLNSDSSTNINLDTTIEYKKINDKIILDTQYENKIIGIAIMLVDNDGNKVDYGYYKNMYFSVGENNYYPENDNETRISLNNGLLDTNFILKVNTNESSILLESGTYYLKIYGYASDDGKYYNNLSNSCINIPINVTSSSKTNEYSFDVKMDESFKIIKKSNGDVNMLFNILENGPFDDPKVKISLYKKDILTAYDQKYILVDLANYTSNILEEDSEKVYYAFTDPIIYDGTESSYNKFNINLITSNFENNGYKFVFDLYDGNKKIETLEKYFIVK